MRGRNKAGFQKNIQERSGTVHSYDLFVKEIDGETVECVEANPDCLEEKDAVPTNPQLIMGEAVEHLQGRQREVYLLHMREGKSLSEVGDLLGMSKDTARTHFDRAVVFVTRWCKDAILRGEF